MYVCVCNGVTDRDIQHAIDSGCDSLGDLKARTGCATACGSCRTLAAQLLDEARARASLPLRVAA